ncbi:MAG: DUF3843 family protein [Muribaculaceae bacterium]|nr:DUF3843 family protein [Muribaculaceae bacterium]
MEKISMREFQLRQPDFTQESETDNWYLEIANQLMQRGEKVPFGASIPSGALKRIALAVTDYLQDIVADGGLWRSFVDANRELYGWSVPFHPEPEEYVDYELNREDVRFLTWYVTAMLWEEKRDLYPHDADLLQLADECFDFLEQVYEDAPVPENWHLARGLEFTDPEDHKDIYRLGSWLFLHSYLLTPAFSVSLRDLMEKVNPDDPDGIAKLNAALEDAMMQDTTGPLALFTPEWVQLIINRKLPVEKTAPVVDTVHPYYEAFTRFTGGKEVAFFDSYEAMNKFFIQALGWAEGEEHLAQAKGADDYVLMVSKYKGMLMARDVARCLKSPDNPYYDRDYASEHDFELFSERGRCPADLLRKAIESNWLPDAVFPGSNDTSLVADNADFIARCYLQFYYRD